MSSAAPLPPAKGQRADPRRDDPLSERKEQRADRQRPETTRGERALASMASRILHQGTVGSEAPDGDGGEESSGKSSGSGGESGSEGSSSNDESRRESPPIATYPNPDPTALARYTQRPSPVAIPPNSISLTYLHSFLSTAECAALIELSTGKFSRSTVGFKAGAGHTSSSRTSHSATPSCSHPAVQAVRRRVAELTKKRDAQIQELQVVRYDPGQRFMPHYDSCGDDTLRSHTIFAYLNDLPDGDGGETEFTRIGVKFKPKKGDALLWENRADRNSYHLDGKHAGRAPLSGVKFGE